MQAPRVIFTKEWKWKLSFLVKNERKIREWTVILSFNRDYMCLTISLILDSTINMKNILVYDINSNSLLHAKHYIIRKWVSLLVYDINSKGDMHYQHKIWKAKKWWGPVQASRQAEKERKILKGKHACSVKSGTGHVLDIQNLWLYIFWTRTRGSQPGKFQCSDYLIYDVIICYYQSKSCQFLRIRIVCIDWIS